jgi:hypothetical protein
MLEDVIVQTGSVAEHCFVILTRPRPPNDPVAVATLADSSAMATGGTRANVNTRFAFI